MRHPMHDLAVVVYARVEGDGPAFIAKFEPFAKHPIFFTAPTAAEAREKADAFAADAVAKNEAAYLARMAGLEKARVKRAEKLAAGE